MLDEQMRAAVLRLHRDGHGIRRIARAVGASRNTVRRVLKLGSPAVPPVERPSGLDEHLELVRELYASCQGNLVRVWEELACQGVTVAYPTLTAFCRRHEIGAQPKKPAGRYPFHPGEEMQHDTSPHTVQLGGRWRPLECASLVLCYSRMLYAQCYGRFSRFECRAFLSQAIQYFGGAAGRCVIDNTSVVRSHGLGRHMVPAAEMAALADRFGFEFMAHDVGDKDRSARVERNFHYIEKNFYAGRSFESLDDLNRQLRQWCDQVNRKPRKLHGEVRAVPVELYAAERSALKPLPLFVPEIYDLHSRRVDVEGYVNLHNNRYSVPVALLGRQLEVRESLERVRIYDGHRRVAEHERLDPGLGKRVTLPEHRGGNGGAGAKKKPPPPSDEEQALRAAAPELGELCSRLRKRYGGQALRAIRPLHRLYLDYPTEYLVAAVRIALAYQVLDLERIERMTLRRIRGDFFRLPAPGLHEGDDEPIDG